MLSDDVFRTKLAAAVAGMRQALLPLGSTADLDLKVEPNRVRLALSPRIPGACPLELLIRPDQLYDIEIGSEFYEDCEIASFDAFEQLIAAIIRGDVVTRHHFSAATGSLKAVETKVSFADGRDWSRRHAVGRASETASPDADFVIKDRTFLPYLR